MSGGRNRAGDPDGVLSVRKGTLAVVEDQSGKKVSAIVRLSFAPQTSSPLPSRAQEIAFALSEEQLRSLATAFTEAVDMIAHPVVGHA